MADRNNEIYDIDDLMDNGDSGEPVEEFYDDEPIEEDRPRRERYDRDDYDDYDDRRRSRSRSRRDRRYDREHPRKKSSILTYVFPFVVLAILVVFSVLFVKEWLNYKVAVDEYKLVKEKIVIPETPVLEEAEDPDFTYPALEIDFDSLLATNPEFVCVIYIPTLDLYYPVAQGDDNSKYLTTTFEGTTNSSGCIFLDTNASPDFSDYNTFIYGHNMKNETMFGSLKEFSAQEDLCARHPYFYLYMADGSVRKYHIFSYYTTPVNDAMYNSVTTDTAYDAYVMRAQSRSYYAPSDEEADDFDLRPTLVTLSTCWGNDHKNNFVVHGALREVYNSSETEGADIVEELESAESALDTASTESAETGETVETAE